MQEIWEKYKNAMALMYTDDHALEAREDKLEAENAAMELIKKYGSWQAVLDKFNNGKPYGLHLEKDK